MNKDINYIKMDGFECFQIPLWLALEIGSVTSADDWIEW